MRDFCWISKLRARLNEKRDMAREPRERGERLRNTPLLKVEGLLSRKVNRALEKSRWLSIGLVGRTRWYRDREYVQRTNRQRVAAAEAPLSTPISWK